MRTDFIGFMQRNGKKQFTRLSIVDATRVVKYLIADQDIEALSQAINKEFMQSHCLAFKYVCIQECLTITKLAFINIKLLTVFYF